MGAVKAKEWQRIFESQPCVEAGSLRSGGHLALHPRGVLLTLGDYEIQPYAQRMDVDYGKILLLDNAGGASVFSLGHRNPQGILADSDGNIWSTEHGPQGGDEINLITEGGNYGWPLVSYGAAYGFDSWTDPWSVAKTVGKETLTNLVDPVHAFTPSVGISELIELVDNTTFPEWSGDLMIASLHELTLFRAKRKGTRLLYFEPIFIGSRIRDLEQSRDGRLLLWTDAGEILSLTREAFESPGSRVYHGRCMSCHDLPSQARNSGVSLNGIVGRPVASLPNFSYSKSLLELGGIWTEERLDSFLENPAGYAPGNAMDVPGVPEPDARRALIEYLRER
jgi:glucose/arabinose dehydrogenase